MYNYIKSIIIVVILFQENDKLSQNMSPSRDKVDFVHKTLIFEIRKINQELILNYFGIANILLFRFTTSITTVSMYNYIKSIIMVTFLFRKTVNCHKTSHHH